MATRDELQAIALEEFATSGYLGTSLQLVADRAGVSKASVLYHFASKELLLEAALTPALDRLGVIVDGIGDLTGTADARRTFLEGFVDFLLANTLAVHIIVIQSAALTDIPVIDRANAEIERLSTFFDSQLGSVEETMRFGIALGGAAYLLASFSRFSGELPDPVAVRAALLNVLGDLLADIPASPARAN